MMDVTNLRNSQIFPATLARESIALIGRKRTGEPIVDFTKKKFVTRVWLKMTGGPVEVRLGFQEIVSGPVQWTERKSFDASVDLYLDFEISGRAISIEFFTNADVMWELEGYEFDLHPAGEF
jgi:hypothetical protein